MGALNLAKRKGEKLLNYEDFGIYKIIMDVQDRKMLDRYCREMLGPVLDYDQKKQTDYAQILREYVETGGQRSGDGPEPVLSTGTPFTTSSRKSGSFCRWIWTIW